MRMPFFIVNAFSQVPFKGNPAGVCLLEKEVSARWMQDVASEVGFPETAFLVPTNHHFHIRWFSPTTEVRLCGHATLAAAHVLWESGVVTEPIIHFTYGEGLLRAQRFYDAIEVAFPEDRPVPCDVGVVAPLGGLPLKAVLRSREDLLVVVSTDEEVHRFQPDFDAIAALDARALVITAASGSQQYDVVSRVFAPGIGIPEDPVTGSAHCALIAYWMPILGKGQLTCFQASSRGGVVFGRLGEGVVRIGGHAVTLQKGEWLL